MSTTPETKKSRKQFILLIIAFAFPVLLAKLALNNDWFNRAATNKGTLLNPTADASVVMGEQDPKWRLFYVIPENCDDKCENAIFAIRQVWTALGRKMDRAEPMVWQTEISDPNTIENLKADEVTRVLKTTQENVNQVFKDEPLDGIFLMDTLNNIILRYPLQQEQEQAVLESRDILADMRKLLKLSRIG